MFPGTPNKTSQQSQTIFTFLRFYFANFKLVLSSSTDMWEGLNIFYAALSPFNMLAIDIVLNLGTPCNSNKSTPLAVIQTTHVDLTTHAPRAVSDVSKPSSESTPDVHRSATVPSCHVPRLGEICITPHHQPADQPLQITS